MQEWASYSSSGNDPYYGSYSGQDYAILDKETAGYVSIKAGVDVHQLQNQRQEQSARQSPWGGIHQEGNMDIVAGEWVFSWNDRNRTDDNTRLPKVQSSLCGAVVPNAEVSDPNNEQQVALARRRFSRVSTLMGLAVTDVNTQYDHPRNNENQGVTIQIAGIMNCYSPLYQMPLGRLVRVRAPTPQETRNPLWVARSGTHPNKVPMIPEVVTGRTLAKQATDTLTSVIHNEQRYNASRHPDERENDADLKVAHVALERALWSGLVMLQFLQENNADSMGTTAAENTAILATMLQLIGESDQDVPVEPVPTRGQLTAAQRQQGRKLRWELAKRLFPDPESVLVVANQIGTTNGVNPGLSERHGRPLSNTYGQMVVRSRQWPDIFSVVHEQALELAASTVGRVVYGGPREFQIIR